MDGGKPKSPPSDGFSMVLTDYESPGPDTTAGAALAQNLDFMESQIGLRPSIIQNIDGLKSSSRPLSDYIKNSSLVIAGSPAPHDQLGNKIGVGEDGHKSSNNTFKQDLFYSLCWHSPESTCIAMTWSANACERLEFWSDPNACLGRALVIAPAEFRTYRPRRGTATVVESLSGESSNDTMLAIFARPRLMSLLQ